MRGTTTPTLKVPVQVQVQVRAQARLQWLCVVLRTNRKLARRSEQQHDGGTPLLCTA